MKGITVEKAGAPAQISDGLRVPEPDEGQVLVKVIALPHLSYLPVLVLTRAVGLGCY